MWITKCTSRLKTALPLFIALAALCPSLASAATLEPVFARAVRVVNAQIPRGQSGEVAIELDSDGNENAVSFTLTFDPTQLAFINAVGGTSLPPGSSFLVNNSQAGSGRVGILLALPIGGSFSPGTHQIARVSFGTQSDASTGATPIGFADTPIARGFSDAGAGPLSGDFIPGQVTISGPLITGLSPSSRPAGGFGFTLTVIGSGFVNGSVIQFDGLDRTTSFIDSMHVAASISDSEITFPRLIPVRVINPGGGGTSNAVLFTVDQPGCGYSISPSAQNFSAAGGTGNVIVTADGGCEWSAVSNVPWVIVTSGSSGNGSGQVAFQVSANQSQTARQGTITIAGHLFTVRQGANFLDVTTNNFFYEFIGKLSAVGITTGCGGGNYCPNSPVTREQMAAFIIRALGEFNPPTPPFQAFGDVPPNNFFYAFIEEMRVRGITTGCSPGLYCPGDPVLREQMAAFIIRALGVFNPPPPPAQRFLDVPPNNFFYAFIEEMAVRGITTGCPAPNYCPGEPVTREQMAAFLVRAFGL